MLHFSAIHLFMVDIGRKYFIFGYMVLDIWLRTIQIVREGTRCRHMGYSFRLAARVLLYASSHRQDNTYHGLCYTSRGALAGMRNSSMGPPHEGSIRRPIAPWANALTMELGRHWSYFMSQPILHDWHNKNIWYILSCLWDGACKRFLAANWNVLPMKWWQWVFLLSVWSFTICPTPYNPD